MKRRERLVESPADDRGAALLMVLLIVLVISLVGAALLTFADTSIRTTVALRSQGAAVYAADGAAQIAVNQLRAGNFNGVANGCSSTAATEVLSNFYAAANGTPVTSALVRCTPDPSNTGIGVGSNSSPGSALLSLGTGAGGEDGIWDGSVNTRTFKVSGGIFSNSNINLGGKSGGTGNAGNSKSIIANISTNSYVFAMGAISGPGAITVVGTTTTTTNYSSNPQSALDRRGWDPQLVPGHGTSFDPPSAPTSTAIVPPCTGTKVYELQPGLYTNAASLNALTGSGNSGACAGSIVHFNPGTYYFNFQDPAMAHKWTSNAAWVVAGTAIGTLSVASPPAMTALNPSCVGPGTTGSSPSSGVEFVFGGDSRMDFTSSGSSDGNIEICASNATSGPPVAIYGLKTAIGAGAMAVPALSGCITATPYRAGGDSGHCALIQSYPDPWPILTIHGTVYAPAAPIDIVFNGSSAQYFQWGLVARTILVNSTGSGIALESATVLVPDTAPAPFALPNIMYLDVYVCPGSSSCSTTGTVQLRAKVLLSATTPTTATVLSWSAQR
jgi:hypothetical protein